VSALHGDNVVTKSPRTPWYAGPSLLTLLESLDAAPGHVHTDARLPVQYVIRDQSRDFRGYAGQVAGGALREGDDVVVLPSGRRTTVAAVETYDGELTEAVVPLSVVVRLTDDVDVSRGDLLASAENTARVTQDVDAVVCWLAEAPLRAGTKYALKHTARWARTVVRSLDALVDVTTLETRGATELRLNDIGRVTLRTASPLAVDPYTQDRTTGAFIVIDEVTGTTIGAGMVASSS
jgi:sulfate adenylyltransferase subunit 1 (EFTu-like GTPase family)